jgi:predicted acyl esterase
MRIFVRVALIVAMAAGIFAPLPTLAQEAKRPDLGALFEKREVMIPVRDGVKLHAEIYTPKNAKEPLPILFERTPYGISAPNNGMSYSLYRYAHMFADGYIFVFQDIRGRYG